MLEGGGGVSDNVELRLDHLHVHFPVDRSLTDMVLRRPRHVVRAVDDVSLSVRPNEVLGLVGETGCGKSTIAKTILRMHPVTSGTIQHRGEDVLDFRGSRLREYYAHVQMVWQDAHSCLNPRMRVREILARPLICFRDMPRSEIDARVRDVMRVVGLNDVERDRYPHEFSGGGRQRIVIARALVSEPSFIIADEPTSSLDVSIQAQILNLLKRLQASYSLTMLYISHNLSTVSFISTRVAVMYFGRIVEVLNTRDLLRRNYHWYTRRLMDAVPKGTPLRSVEVGLEAESRLDYDGCIYRYRCENAKERCRTERPMLRDLEDGHAVACHFPVEDRPGPGVARPNSDR